MNISSTNSFEIPFKNSKGAFIPDVEQHIKDWLDLHPEGKIFVGCDSKVRGKTVKYATVICMWDVGHGVWEIYKNLELERPKDRYTRLWNEVMMSVELAETLKGLGNIHVHMDFNSDPKYASYQLYDAGIGLVNSMGFIGAGKPNAWAATSGANRHCQ